MLLGPAVCAAADADKTEAEESNATEEPKQEADDSLIGSQVGLTYENQRFGVGCELPEGWRVYSPEELASLLGLTSDLWNNEPLTEAIESFGNVYLFFAVSDDASKNVALITQTWMGEDQCDELLHFFYPPAQ